MNSKTTMIPTKTKNRLFTILASGAAAGALTIAGAAITHANAQAPRLMAPPVAADGTLSFADLVERVSPAVVSVIVEGEVDRPALPEQLEDFFQFRFGPGQPAPEDEFQGGRRVGGLGSGFFVDGNGHIVTNNHVVDLDGADTVKVRLADGTELDAEIVGTDELTDLAVLKVDADRNQPFVEFAEGANLRVGDWVVAVGNPFGLGGTVTSGIVSAIGGQAREYQYLDFIQIDAPINTGNSGGPTFDLKGRVVGVNTAIQSPNGGSVGIGFAIPAKVAKETVDQLIANGAVTRGWLGIQLQEVTNELAAALGLKNGDGVLVADVLGDTPAAKAGLVSEDVILAINGEDVANANALSRRVASYAPGEKIRLKVWRDNKERNVTVTLGERDAQDTVASAEPANDNDDVIAEVGLRVARLDDATRQQYRVPSDIDGVVVTGVRRGSAADDADLQRGVVITEFDGEPVTSRSDLSNKIENAIEDGDDAVLLRLQFGQNRRIGALSLEDL